MLHSFNFGKGKPILWLHGFLGNALNFKSLAKSIEGEHYLLDARNHGRSFHDWDMSYKAMAEDLFRFLDQYAIEKCSVIGHSMGGKTATWAACKEPQRFESVCLLDIAPIDFREALDTHYQELRSILNFMKHLDLNQPRPQIEKYSYLHFDDPMHVALILSNLRAVAHNTYEWRVDIDNLEQGLETVADWPSVSEKFEGPCIALCGSNSTHTCKSPLLKDLALKSFFTQHFPRVEVRVIEETGHFLHIEKPREVSLQISNFLKAVTS